MRATRRYGEQGGCSCGGKYDLGHRPPTSLGQDWGQQAGCRTEESSGITTWLVTGLVPSQGKAQVPSHLRCCSGVAAVYGVCDMGCTAAEDNGALRTRDKARWERCVVFGSSAELHLDHGGRGFVDVALGISINLQAVQASMPTDNQAL